MPILATYMVPHPPMIVPEVGRGDERQVEATSAAYERVAEDIAEKKPGTIIIASPHATMYADYFHISPGHGAKATAAIFGALFVRITRSHGQRKLWHSLKLPKPSPPRNW